MNAGGFKPFLVRNAADLKALLTNNKTYIEDIYKKNNLLMIISYYIFIV